jgi:uncharacterized membrane protein YqgA involved in biofilm formation
MFPTYVNSITVVVGSLIGLIIHRSLKEQFKEAVFISIGLITLVIGMKMSLESGKILILALSLVGGGLIGYALKIEQGIYRFGELLNRRFVPNKRGQKEEHAKNFPLGFLNASVLFCVGAMTIIGAFRAGTEADFDLLLTKSVMDGFMAILLTASYGIGVAFSIIPILVYQGGLTLLSKLISPYVNEILLAELSAVGGTMIIMIGLNLLKVKEIKTANFLPALVLVPLLLYGEKLLQF